MLQMNHSDPIGPAAFELLAARIASSTSGTVKKVPLSRLLLLISLRMTRCCSELLCGFGEVNCLLNSSDIYLWSVIVFLRFENLILIGSFILIFVALLLRLFMVLHSFDELVLWSKELMNSRHFFSLLLRIDIWIRLFSSSIFGECGSRALSSSLSVIHSLASSESWGITSLRLPDGMWCFYAVFMTFRSTASPWYTSVGPGWFLSALSISSWKAGQSDLAMLLKVRLGARMSSRNDED